LRRKKDDDTTMKRKRTHEELEAELQHIHKEAIRLVRILAGGAEIIGLYREQRKARVDLHKLMKLLSKRDRTDRCYYCGSYRKEELSVEPETGLIWCHKCEENYYMELYRGSRREYYRIREN
jgi:hypothetical protein